jgi:hypothetical protein
MVVHHHYRLIQDDDDDGGFMGWDGNVRTTKKGSHIVPHIKSSRSRRRHRKKKEVRSNP